jgi:transposase
MVRRLNFTEVWRDRQNMRLVPIKIDDQFDLQALHRVHDRLIIRRTSVINQLRAFLLERGLVFAKSPAKLRERMPEIPENGEEELTPRMRIHAHLQEQRAATQIPLVLPAIGTHQPISCPLQGR